MAETIKCSCSSCGAKYRLPVEAQGRTARCKRCGEKFEVPLEQSLEDSVLTWLNNPLDDEDETPPERPKVISMPKEERDEQAEEAARKARGPIRMKSGSKNESS